MIEVDDYMVANKLAASMLIGCAQAYPLAVGLASYSYGAAGSYQRNSTADPLA